MCVRNSSTDERNDACVSLAFIGDEVSETRIQTIRSLITYDEVIDISTSNEHRRRKADGHSKHYQQPPTHHQRIEGVDLSQILGGANQNIGGEIKGNN